MGQRGLNVWRQPQVAVDETLLAACQRTHQRKVQSQQCVETVGGKVCIGIHIYIRASRTPVNGGWIRSVVAVPRVHRVQKHSYPGDID